ncbi:hypothetical protein RAA17_00990 [Komagataeibacter rhaeticus]|nr:hypothetical protein [Komagataeibacter rhaeticus]
MTQVDWYKASFDEIREVASRFEEDPAYATLRARRRMACRRLMPPFLPSRACRT